MFVLFLMFGQGFFYRTSRRRVAKTNALISFAVTYAEGRFSDAAAHLPFFFFILFYFILFYFFFFFFFFFVKFVFASKGH